jgi:hypothetical protein
LATIQFWDNTPTHAPADAPEAPSKALGIDSECGYPRPAQGLARRAASLEGEFMLRVEEKIPEPFAAETEAARVWFTNERGTEFKLAGIVNPDDVLASDSATGAREFQLILCGSQAGQDVCLRERFEVRRARDGFDVTHLEEPGQEIGSPAPTLDPPAGVRAAWLDDVLAKHSFVVLVFYRGFW